MIRFKITIGLITTGEQPMSKTLTRIIGATALAATLGFASLSPQMCIRDSGDAASEADRQCVVAHGQVVGPPA